MNKNSVSAHSSPLFARQPIFDCHNEIVAYELLFRPIDRIGTIDGDLATAQVLLNSFAESTLSVAVDNTCAYINFTDNWLLETPPFGPENVVIEVLETVKVTPKLLKTMKNLFRQGYTIALDDFTLDLDTALLIPYASVIKIDVLAQTSVTELTSLVQTLKQYSVKLLAEKVEDYASFQQCKALGFDLFQGFYFCKPEIVEDRIVNTNRAATLDLLSKLNDPEVEITDIKDALKKDPVLAVKLLKLVNSAQFSRKNNIGNLHKAIMALGLRNLKRWVTLVALTTMDEKPTVLLKQALTRARTMENIAHKIPEQPADLFFFVGLFSYMDAFFDTKIETLIASLPLEDWMKEAIVHRSGLAGELLVVVDAFESADWAFIDQLYLPVCADEINTAYIESLEWVASTLKNLN